MTKASTAKHKPPYPEEIIAEQKRQAAKDTAARKAAVAPPVPAKVVAVSAAVTSPTPDTRTNVQRYLDEVAPASIVGRLIKFSKEGKFIFGDTDEEVAESMDFIALCDQTVVGWIKFYNDGETPPDRVMGLLYGDFVMPARSTLGDTDESQWPDGLDGKPEDPWKHQQLLVLQQAGTSELFTFATASKGGRRAVGNLLRHYDRIQRLNPDELPVVRLKPGGYIPRDPRRGDWQPVPVFAVNGRAPRDSAAKPDTSLAADLNDELPGLLKGTGPSEK